MKLNDIFNVGDLLMDIDLYFERKEFVDNLIRRVQQWYRWAILMTFLATALSAHLVFHLIHKV